MKQKIFTLLLAIGVLTAFQANAQQRQKIRIKAETSGLANTKPGGVVRHDSFPFAKTASCEWLSVSGGKLIVKSATDTSNYGYERELYQDQSAIFELGFGPNKDSTSFKFFIPAASEPLTLKEEATEEFKNYFEIIQLVNETNLKTQKKSSGYFGKLVSDSVNENEKRGYLVSVRNSSLKLDTIEFSLVGADRDGNLSLKEFKNFAFYGDSVPYAPYTAYQYDTIFDPGKLYQSKLFPYFQIYKNDSSLINIRTDNKLNNWGNITGKNPNTNDSIVYSWLDIKLSGDSAVVLLGKTIRLDSIKFFADTLTHLRFSGFVDNINRTWRGLDTTSFHRDSISPFISKNNADSAYHVYLKNENGSLSFTVKTDSTGNEKDWTNGYPTKFTSGSDSLYYRIDTMMISILPDIIQKFVLDRDTTTGWTLESLFNPTQNHISRYLYKNNDDSWRPLYVKIEDVETDEGENIPAEYVGWEWVKENRYNLSAAVQTIAGQPGLAVSNGAGGISFTSNADESAKFKFELVDSIQGGKIVRHTKYPEGTTQPNFDNDESTIELFRIRDASNYLTVLDTTEFTDAGSTSNIVDGIQLGWDTDLALDSTEYFRQMFAIVRNYVDSSITFLPVASHKWKMEGGKVKCDDMLSFNLGIGRLKKASGTVDFGGTWYLTAKRPTFGSGDLKLVIADSSTAQPHIWFKLEKSTLVDWTGTGGDYVSIKKGNQYYHGDGDLAGSISDMNNDIKAHWKISKVNVSGKNAWKFTPVVDTIYGNPVPDKHFAGDTVFAFEGEREGEAILVDNTSGDVLDTVVVSDINPTKFSLFAELNTAEVTTIVSGKGEYITLGTELKDGNDSIYVASYDTTRYENRVTAIKSNVKHLADSLYPIHHYIFSIEKGSRKYFLNAGESKVRWVSLDSVTEAKLRNSTDTAYASYKFALPKFEDEVYLQTLDTGRNAGPRVIRLAISKKLEVADVQILAEASRPEGIYSAIDFYNKGKNDDILVWQFPNDGTEDPDEDEEWLSSDEADLGFGEDDDKVEGVLSGDWGSIGYKEDGGVKYGILQDNAPLTLQRPAATRSTAAGSEKGPETYYIMSGEFYLSDEGRKDARATFTDEPQEFAFLKADGDQFAIVSAASIGGERRFLGAMGNNLIFTTDGNFKLDFTWKESEATGIKAITASGKIYGVAGGVKVSGATGAVAIYTVDGRLVTKKTVTSPNQTIAVPAGIYVVRNGAEVTKVVVK